ncbi:hypothetical protein CYMTET_21000 [Cymbomonas tetramitiformis]|uniref:Uncharacterized protein n=1 Tax=Cymbomonas tetramitiformis TaxID=36881 RepID=A0AAE0G315_9CHLO|nr:hypothetical protein CYMTET_21000 [Cymbomonas tetramitiformis]
MSGLCPGSVVQCGETRAIAHDVAPPPRKPGSRQQAGRGSGGQQGRRQQAGRDSGGIGSWAPCVVEIDIALQFLPLTITLRNDLPPEEAGIRSQGCKSALLRTRATALQYRASRNGSEVRHARENQIVLPYNLETSHTGELKSSHITAGDLRPFAEGGAW